MPVEALEFSELKTPLVYTFFPPKVWELPRIAADTFRLNEGRKIRTPVPHPPIFYGGGGEAPVRMALLIFPGKSYGLRGSGNKIRKPLN